MTDLQELTEAIEAGNRRAAERLVTEAIAELADPQSALEAMTIAMEHIGGRFQRGEIYVPEMLVSARAMKSAAALLEPMLVAAGIRPTHSVVIGTVEGDLHDIGKNLVGMMWKGAGIEVIDLGTNVKAQHFAEAAREHGASLIGVSALLTTTMVRLNEIVGAVRAAGLIGVHVVVGGAPVTQEYADDIGADGYAPDAATAVDVAKRLLNA